jgi:hypothetical protein
MLGHTKKSNDHLLPAEVTKVIVKPFGISALIKCFYISVFLFVTAVTGDEVDFKNGQEVTTQIVDTSGCSIKIIRNGNEVVIRKSIVKRIIVKSDTLSYENYICNEKAKPIVKTNETPEYKLMAILDNSSMLDQMFKENSKIAFLYSPLQGSYNSDEFIGIQLPLIEILKKRATVKMISPPELLTEINSELHKYDYVFIVRKYHVEVNDIKHGGFFDENSNIYNEKNNMYHEKKKELYTWAVFIMYDIDRKEIVFRKELFEKRSVYGLNEYSWTGMLTPESWQKEWEKNIAEEKLDKNAQAIKKKMEKEISEYTGLKK